jgi:hypothetical protein
MPLVAIKYVGKKASEVDHLYGSNLVWDRETSHWVEASIAQKLLGHPDVWAINAEAGEAPATGIAPVVKKAPKQDEPELPIMVNIGAMTKAEIITHTMREFGVSLNPKAKIDELRADLTKLNDERLFAEGTHRTQDAPDDEPEAAATPTE